MYMIVTNDAFELALGVFDTQEEVAAYLNTSVSAVAHRVARGSKRSTTEKIIKIGKKRTAKQKKIARKKYQERYRKQHDRSEYFRQYYQKKKERKNNEQGT